MKIAFLVGGFPRTTETFILNQVTGLIDLGHEVDIYAKRRHEDTAIHADVLRYGLLERTNYFDIPLSRLGRIGRVARAFRDGGVRHARALIGCANPRRYGSWYAGLNNVVYAVPFLKKRYDVLMCHYGTNGIDFIFLKDLLPDVPFVTMFHAGDIRLGDEEGSQVYARLREQGDVFLAISDCYNRKKLVEFGFDNNRIVTHRIGVDVERVCFHPKTPEPGVLRLLTVARLDPEKGLEHAIRAVGGLLRSVPEVKVTYKIIGAGVLRAPLSNLIDTLGLRDVIALAGPQPTEVVVDAMHACDVFLLPSLAEATPTVLLEAQATGTPFVATSVNGVPEIVRDRESGLLVPPGDEAAIERALAELAADPKRRDQLGRAGRAFVEEQHDIRKLDRRLAEIFADAIHASKRRGWCQAA